MSIKSGILMNTRVLDTFVQFKEFFFLFSESIGTDNVLTFLELSTWQEISYSFDSF